MNQFSDQPIETYIPPGSAFDQTISKPQVAISDEGPKPGPTISILSVPFWPKASLLGANKNLRMGQLGKGEVAKVKGLIGFAPFPILNEQLEPLGACMVLASTVPLRVTDNPLTAGRPYDAQYGEVQTELPFRLFVSTNIEASVMEAIAASIAGQSIPAARSFEGDVLYLTFNSTVAASIAGPSSSVATYVAVNGYSSPFYWTGEIGLDRGNQVLMRIAGLSAKVKMIAGQGRTLVAPVFADDLPEIPQGLLWVAPGAARLGITKVRGKDAGLIGAADLGTITVLAMSSMAQRIEPENRSHSSSVASEVPPSRGPSEIPEGMVPLLATVKAYQFPSVEAFMEASAEQAKPKAVTKVVEATGVLDKYARSKGYKGVLDPKFYSDIEAAGLRIGSSVARVSTVVGTGQIPTIEAWLRQAETFGAKKDREATRIKGPSKQDKKEKLPTVMPGAQAPSRYRIRVPEFLRPSIEAPGGGDVE